jgi:hypothetical protein
MAVKFWKHSVAITALRCFRLQSTPFNLSVDAQNLLTEGSRYLVVFQKLIEDFFYNSHVRWPAVSIPLASAHPNLH